MDLQETIIATPVASTETVSTPELGTKNNPQYTVADLYHGVKIQTVYSPIQNAYMIANTIATVTGVGIVLYFAGKAIIKRIRNK